MEAGARQAQLDGGDKPLWEGYIREGQHRLDHSAHTMYQENVKSNADPVYGRHELGGR